MRVIGGLLAATVLLCAASPRSLYRQARAAEKRGNYWKAWSLATQAVALAPENPAYWSYAEALRRRGLEKAEVTLAPAAGDPPVAGLPEAPEPPEARELLPPPLLRPLPVTRTFDLRADSRRLFEEVLKAYGLECVFDGDYQPTPPVRFRLENVPFDEALRALEAVTGSFAVAVNERVALVAKDTAQKRQQIEPVMAITIPFDESITVQEVQEASRAIQSTFDLQKVGVDTQRRLIVFRDRVSRLRPAVRIFEQLMTHRGQVVVDLELLTLSENSTLSFGTNLPTSFRLVYFGSDRLDRSGPLPNIPAGLTGNFLTFGKGNGMFGIGLTDAQLFAAMTRGVAETLTRSTLRSLDGQPASFHVGDRFPIITQQFAGPGQGEQIPEDAYRPPPQIQFEELGVVIKLTPWLHGTEEVTLELNAEFKQLAGETVNEIPVISNRKYETKVRLRLGQSAVVAGLETELRSRGWRGFPLLGAIAPPLRSNTFDVTRQQLLVVLTPRLVATPPAETVTRAVWVGTETRPLTPLD